MSFGKNVLAGLAGGIIGGAVLSLIEMGGMKAGRIPTPLIVAMEHRLEDKLNIAERSTHGQKVFRSQLLHFGTTAFYGVIFGLLRSLTGGRRIAQNIPVTGMQSAQSTPRMGSALAGPLFGLGIFTAVLGWIMPALGLTRAPWQMKRGVAMRELALHLLYGSIVAGVVRAFTRREEYMQPEHQADYYPPVS